MYHCTVIETLSTVYRWSGTYLLIKGNTQKTSEINVVQWSTVSGPAHPEDLVTFNCSVLSQKRTCEGDFSVFWFRAGSHKSYPDIIYSDGNRSHECGKRTDIQKSCFHHLSKKVSSSDAGTYYCAVVTCEEILFGNGTKLEIESTGSPELFGLVIAVISFVISVIINIIFICYRSPRVVCGKMKRTETSSPQTRSDSFTHPLEMSNEDGYDLNYAAINFSGGKAKGGRKSKEQKTEESVYSQVRL
ncbi:signal-regulatory protein beta-2-like [Pholidichthys leucotaenia]